MELNMHTSPACFSEKIELKKNLNYEVILRSKPKGFSFTENGSIILYSKYIHSNSGKIMEIHYTLLVIHVIVGLVLVFYATKAFKKTHYPPMLLLAVGFALIVLGDTVIGDILDMLGNQAGEVIEEGIEIAGFITLILAVKRS
jgi:hypothetical protein